METRKTPMMRALSMLLSVCLVLGMVYLPAQATETEPETTPASILEGDTLYFYDDFADYDWTEKSVHQHTAPGQHVVLTNKDAKTGIYYNYNPEDCSDGSGLLATTGKPSNMTITFKAKANGPRLNVTSCVGLYGGGADRYYTLRFYEGKIYNGADTEIGTLPEGFNIAAWHTYQLRWYTGGGYFLELSIDGTVISLEGTTKVAGNTGSTDNRLQIFADVAAGTVEIDDVVVTDIAVGNTNKLNCTFEEGTENPFEVEASAGCTAEMVETEGTGILKLVGVDGAQRWAELKGVAEWNVAKTAILSFDAKMGENGGQVAMEISPIREKDGVKTLRRYYYSIQTAMSEDRPAGLYRLGSDNVAGTPVVDLSNYDLTEWHTYTLVSDVMTEKVYLMIDGVRVGTDVTFPQEGVTYYSSGTTVRGQATTIKIGTIDLSGVRQAPTGEAYIDNLKLTYNTFAEDAAVTTDGATATWTAVEGLTYDVYLDGEIAAEAVAEATYTFDVNCAAKHTVKVLPAGANAASKGLTAEFQLGHTEATKEVTEEEKTYVVTYCSVCDAQISKVEKEEELPCEHTNTTAIQEAVAATCTTAGSTAGVKCADCDEVIEAVAEIPALGHTEVAIQEAVAPTCTTAGATAGTKCSVCGEVIEAVAEIPATGHTEVEIPAVDATCTTAGATAGTKCSVCGETITAPETIDALGHTEAAAVEETREGVVYLVVYCSVCNEELSATVKPEEVCEHTNKVAIQAPVDATCTTAGSTAGEKCADCGETITAVEEIPALGHNEVAIQEAIGATCTTAGQTAGKKCSVCGETIEAAAEIPALGHTEAAAVEETREGVVYLVVYCSVCNEELSAVEKACEHTNTTEIPAVAATCTTAGSTAGVKCADCGETITAPETVEALGHTEVEIPAVAATCTTAGSTAGVKCSVCGETITAPETIDALGHTEVAIQEAVDATCSTAGSTAGVKCSVCGETIEAVAEIPALGHTEVEIPAVAATCTTAGATAGTKCSVCGETITAPETIDALGHTEVAIQEAVDATCSTAGSTAGVKCSVCGETIEAVAEIPALGHTEAAAVEEDREGVTYLVVYCSVCGEEVSATVKPTTVVVPELVVGENGQLAIQGEYKRAIVFYLAGNADFAGKANPNWSKLVAEGKKYVAMNGTNGYKTYQVGAELPALAWSGNYAVSIKYNDAEGVEKTIWFTPSVEGEAYHAPVISVDESGYISVDVHEADTFLRVCLFYIADYEPQKNPGLYSGWIELIKKGKEYKTINGSEGYRVYTDLNGLPQLGDPSNYAILVKYNGADGTLRTAYLVP